MESLNKGAAEVEGTTANYKIITVPLDGTPQAEQALPWAVQLARSLSACLQLVRVVRIDTLLNYDDYEYEVKLVNQARDYLDDVKAILTDHTLPACLTAKQVRTEVICGRAADEITRFALLTRSDLIVMTTHARPPLPNLLLGSVALKVVQLASQPVILLPPTHPDEQPSLREQMADLKPEPDRQRRIVVALDGTAEAEMVLEPVIELAQVMDATVFLLRVVLPVYPIQYAGSYYAVNSKIEINIEKEQADAYEYLERIRSQILDRDLRCFCVVRVEMPITRPAEEIVDYSDKARATLVAMATHARSNLGRLVFGSVSDEVLRHTHTPVLFLHPTYTPAAALEKANSE